MMPLALLGAVIAILAIMLVLLTGPKAAQQPQAAALCPLNVEEVERFSYAGSNVEVTLLKGGEGNWLWDADPALPLDQAVVQALLDRMAALTPERALTAGDAVGLPARAAVPLMRFELATADQTWTLEADSLNESVKAYYVYDEAGNVYTVAQSDLTGLCKAPRALYAPQTLTEYSADDAVRLQTGDLAFVKQADRWVLQETPEQPIDQDTVNKMANTLCELTTNWTITAPEQDAAYGLDHPDVEALLTFADGTELTVRFGAPTADDDTLCYLVASSAPGLVYETNAGHKAAFAVTKEQLYAATPETAAEDNPAQYPVGSDREQPAG